MERTIRNENDKVWVTIGPTINLGNFENIKIDVGRSRTIKKNDDPNELIEAIMNELIKIVEKKGIVIKNK